MGRGGRCVAVSGSRRVGCGGMRRAAVTGSGREVAGLCARLFLNTPSGTVTPEPWQLMQMTVPLESQFWHGPEQTAPVPASTYETVPVWRQWPQTICPVPSQ